MRQEGLWCQNYLLMVSKDTIDDEIEDPYQIVLTYKDRNEGYQSQPPFTLGQVVVEHCCDYRHAS